MNFQLPAKMSPKSKCTIQKTNKQGLTAGKNHIKTLKKVVMFCSVCSRPGFRPCFRYHCLRWASPRRKDFSKDGVSFVECPLHGGPYCPLPFTPAESRLRPGFSDWLGRGEVWQRVWSCNFSAVAFCFNSFYFILTVVLLFFIVSCLGLSARKAQ